MLLFNLRSQYRQQRKTGSAIKAVINTPCCGNTCKGGKKKVKKILGVPPINNIKKQPGRKYQTIYNPQPLSPNIYEIPFMLTELY